MASTMDTLMERAIQLLIAQVPPETMARIGQLAQTGVELKEQLDRIERGQGELRTLLVALVEQLAHNRSADNAERIAAKRIPGPRVCGTAGE